MHYLRAAILCAAVIALGCKTRTGGVGTLPSPPQDAKASPYQPSQPFRLISPGLSVRTLHTAQTPQGFRVELRELLIGPGKRGVAVDLEGGALAEVISGRGGAAYGGKRENLATGATLSIP